ncbi:Pentatricopeptide repeat [Quillaja saponaria]|uniref:Pentatricopeptide repeat n=1 Tax=Quillaja saponaria TaxID=32244 RepID=A0AAD7LIR4_QUISA|nr:Pentatricopeptide repeat [Quillaja saponaria]
MLNLILFQKPRCVPLSMRFLLFRPKSIPVAQVPTQRYFSSSDQSWLTVPSKPIINWPSPLAEPTLNPNSSSDFSRDDFSTISNLLTDPSISPGTVLETALDRTGFEPSPILLQAVFDHFRSSTELLLTLFLWTEKQPGFHPSISLFNSMINVLGKAKEFDSAWDLVHCRIGRKEGAAVVSRETFAILIRRYARAGLPQSAIRTYEFVRNLNSFLDSESERRLFEILLDSLCKEGSVSVASDYFTHRRKVEPCWVSSIRVYNILLNGWFRSRKLKEADKFWAEMKRDNVKPTVATYGILVGGYCLLRHPEKGMELIEEMIKDRIEPNAIVYNPIIYALAEAGRFKEALGMMERFLVLESGPTNATYNSLVKGFCKSGDLVGASKILKMMISRGVIPTPVTYKYFFTHFSKTRKIEEGMNLYTKMIESGYIPDRITYHLILKMLCEEGRLDLAVQVRKEMRCSGYDMDLATSTLLVHLLFKMHRFEEALSEFEDMIRRGLPPQYLTFQRMNGELKKRGMTEMARKLCDLMSSVPSSMKIPNTYNEDGDAAHRRRKYIMRKAEAISDMMKSCKDPREFANYRRSSENPVSTANHFMKNTEQKLNKR